MISGHFGRFQKKRDQTNKRSFDQAFEVEPTKTNVITPVALLELKPQQKETTEAGLIFYASGVCQPSFIDKKRENYLCWAWICFLEPAHQILSHRVSSELMREEEYVSDTKATLIGILNSLKWFKHSSWRQKEFRVALKTDNSTAFNHLNESSCSWECRDANLKPIIGKIRVELSKLSGFRISAIIKQLNLALPLVMDSIQTTLVTKNVSHETSTESDPRPNDPTKIAQIPKKEIQEVEPIQIIQPKGFIPHSMRKKQSNQENSKSQEITQNLRFITPELDDSPTTIPAFFEDSELLETADLLEEISKFNSSNEQASEELVLKPIPSPPELSTLNQPTIIYSQMLILPDCTQTIFTNLEMEDDSPLKLIHSGEFDHMIPDVPPQHENKENLAVSVKNLTNESIKRPAFRSIEKHSPPRKAQRIEKEIPSVTINPDGFIETTTKPTEEASRPLSTILSTSKRAIPNKIIPSNPITKPNMVPPTKPISISPLPSHSALALAKIPNPSHPPINKKTESPILPETIHQPKPSETTKIAPSVSPDPRGDINQCIKPFSSKGTNPSSRLTNKFTPNGFFNDNSISTKTAIGDLDDAPKETINVAQSHGSTKINKPNNGTLHELIPKPNKVEAPMPLKPIPLPPNKPIEPMQENIRREKSPIPCVLKPKASEGKSVTNLIKKQTDNPVIQRNIITQNEPITIAKREQAPILSTKPKELSSKPLQIKCTVQEDIGISEINTVRRRPELEEFYQPRPDPVATEVEKKPIQSRLPIQRKEKDAQLEMKSSDCGIFKKPTDLPIESKKRLTNEKSKTEMKVEKQRNSSRFGFLTRIILTDDDFSVFLKGWESQSLFSWHFHWTSNIKKNAKDKTLDDEMYTFLPGSCVVEGLLLSWNPDIVYFVSLKKSRSKNVTPLSIQARWEAIKTVMTSQATKVCFHAKSQLKILLSHDIHVQEGLWDTKIAAWILSSDQNKDKNLDQLYTEKTKDSLQVQSDGPYDKSFLKVQKSLKLMMVLEKEFQEKDEEYKIFREIEMKITPILAKMEFLGIGFDHSNYDHQSSIIKKKIDILEKRAYHLAGQTFAMTSPAEVSKVMFQDMKIPYPVSPDKKKKKPSLSTKCEVLEAVQHPLASLVLQHRKLSHTINTYIDSLPKFAFWNESFQMERIYAMMLQTAVPTGRLACTDPNLQSITHSFQFNPSKDSTSTQIDASQSSPVTINIRNSFIPTKGHSFISADFSQLELRIMAHLSMDSKLVSILRQPDHDIFISMACTWLNKKPEDVTPTDRSHTKHICYGILYGMGPSALSMEIGVSKQAASKLINSFKRAYPGVNSYLNQIIRYCEEKGYVKTILGRRRYLPGIFSKSDFKVRSQAERQAINTICQGSAADICKRAMIDVVEFLKAKDLKSQMLLQLHDELLFEVPHNEIEILMEAVPRLMTACIRLNVPLPVKMVMGESWGSLQPIEVITTEG